MASTNDCSSLAAVVFLVVLPEGNLRDETSEVVIQARSPQPESPQLFSQLLL
jgi:hypothetical protein